MNFANLKTMSCKCFNTTPPNDSIAFKERVELCKCKCDSRLVATEKRCKFTLKKTNAASIVDKIKIDNYLFCTTEFKKCDYLFYHSNKNNEVYIFVELKGTDLNTAIKQLENTINIFYDEGYLYKKRIRGAIAHTGVPSANGSYRKAKLLLEAKIKKKIIDFRIEQKGIKITYNPDNDSFTQE